MGAGLSPFLMVGVVSLLMVTPLRSVSLFLRSSPLKRDSSLILYFHAIKLILGALSLFKGDEWSAVNTEQNGGGNNKMGRRIDMY